MSCEAGRSSIALAKPCCLCCSMAGYMCRHLLGNFVQLACRPQRYPPPGRHAQQVLHEMGQILPSPYTTRHRESRFLCCQCCALKASLCIFGMCMLLLATQRRTIGESAHRDLEELYSLQAVVTAVPTVTNNLQWWADVQDLCQQGGRVALAQQSERCGGWPHLA